MKQWWYVGFIIIALCGAIIVGRGVHRHNRHCYPQIQHQLAHAELLELDDAWLEKRPYFFLGKGRQCRVFESFDGKYVVKISSSRLTRKSQLAYLGGWLALQHAPQETGVCAVGVGKKNRYLRVLSQKGKIQLLPLHDRYIVIQQKASSLKRALVISVAQGNMELARHYIREIFDVLKRLREKHLLDQDGALIRNGNLGLLDGHVILMDTGRLSLFMDRYRHSLHDMHRLKPLRSWLYSLHPELVACFDTCHADYMHLTHEPSVTS